jgi:hypothetical protein
MRYKKFSALLVVAVLLPLSFNAFSQTARDMIFGTYGRIGGLCHSYESDSVAFYKRTPAPSGYVPFYISHFGRHGSRWLTTPPEYAIIHELMEKADSDSVLTPLGERFRGQIDTIYNDAFGQWGELTPRGVAEQKGVAKRMYESFPEVFHDGACIQSRSTMVYRTILSMSAFDEGLKEMNPSLKITREVGERYQKYLSRFDNMNVKYDEIRRICDSVSDATLDPSRFLSSLISDTAWIAANVAKPRSLFYNLYGLASDMEDVSYLGIDLYHYFTQDELWSLYNYDAIMTFLYCGPSVLNGAAAMKDEIPLLTNIIETADRVVSDGSQAATLRFGHDTNITPLQMLMGIQEYGTSTMLSDLSKVSENWYLWIISPMCSNIQIVFYRNATADVIVKILHNEKEVSLPIEAVKWPYYRWSDVRAFWMGRMDDVR